eukprot:1219660-Heterocapsa_arctica.AAC.1
MASQLLYIDSKVAQMAIGTAGIYFIFLLLFISLSFRRLVEQVKNMPVVASMPKTMRSVLADGW